MGRTSTGIKFLVLGLLALTPVDSKSLRALRSTPRFATPLGPFSRAAVEQPPAEQRPDQGAPLGFSAALRKDDPQEFGSRRLPLRSAVESVPPKYLRLEESRRLPLRDAVERRPPAYDDDLFALTDELESLGIDPWAQRTTDKNQKPPDKLQQHPGSSHYLIQLTSGEREQYSQFSTSPAPPAGPQRLQYYGAAKPYNKKPPVVDLHYAAYKMQNSHGPIDRFRIDNSYQELVHSPYHVRMDEVEDNVQGRQFHEEARQSYEAQPPRKVVCYVSGWAAYRRPPLAFSAAWLPPACSHVLYAFAAVDPHQLELIPNDHEYDIVQGGYRMVTGLKRNQPNLKVLVSVGGPRGEGARRLSRLAALQQARRNFAQSAVNFCKNHGFDGIDLHWQYPGAEDYGGNADDKKNLVLLLQEIKTAFDIENLLISLAVPASRYRVEDGYDVPAVGELVEWVTLQAFDLQADKESCSIADHHSPLLPRPTDTSPTDAFYNVDYGVRYWLKRGLPRSRLVLGVPLFGRSFRLESPGASAPGSRANGPGEPGAFTNTKGMLAYFEVCEALGSGEWRQERDAVGSPYMVKGDQWVGYDDVESIRNKMLYVLSLNLGGGAVWAADLDDFRGLCGQPWPLLTALSNTLKEIPLVSDEGGMRAIGPCVRSEEDDGALVSDPLNCAAFFLCRRGQKYRIACPQGTLFNPEAAICLVMDPSKCLPGQSRVVHMPENNAVIQAVNNDLTREYYKVKEADKEKLVVCYMTNWAFYRKGDGKFVPEHLDPRLCSHVVYAFASLDPDNLVPKEFDPWADIDNNLYARVTALKDTRVLLGLGGWTDSAGDKYSQLVRSAEKRKNFVTSTVAFLKRYGFRGLHLDWNYPKCWQSNCAKGPADDKPNFSKLVQELSQEFKRQNPPMDLGVAVSGYKEVIDVAYDLPQLSKDASFLSAMTYDYHGGWEPNTEHGSPLYSKPQSKYPQYTTDFAIKYLISQGADPGKLLLGLPFYGQSFQLAGAEARGGRTGPGAEAAGPGAPGDLTRQPGMLAYYEICYRVKSLRWQTGRQDGAGPYAYSKDQWVGYEDPASITEKVEYGVRQGLGGVAAWSVDLDDFSNTCCAESYPLLRAAARALRRLGAPPPPATTAPCTRPDPPSTPAPPVVTTVFDSGAANIPSTTSPSSTTWWSPPSSTTAPTTKATTSSSSTPWWSPPSSTAAPTTKAPTTTTTTAATTTTTARPPPTTPAATSEKEPDRCVAGSYSPDPGSCTTYLQCSGGENRKQSCAPGLHWNAQANLCDWPATAKCQSDSVSPAKPMRKPSAPTSARPQSPSPTSARPSRIPVTTTTSPAPTTTKPSRKPSRRPQKHPNACVNGAYYAHQECSKFNICVNGIQLTQSCAPGEGWSPGLSICAPGLCKSRRPAKIRPKIKKTSPVLRAPCQAGDFSPYPGDCGRYQQCLWEKLEAFQCAPGLHWNKERNICDWPASAQCTEEEDLPSVIEIGGEDGPEPEIPASSTTHKPQHKPGDWVPPTVPTTTTTTTTTIATPEDNDVAPLSGYYKIVCYFTNWAWYRRGLGKYLPEDIDPNLCTHIVYGFAVMDSENLVIRAHDSWADFDNKFYERVTAYKKKGLKVLLALGGWNDSAGDKYSRLVNNPSSRKKFINHALGFLEKHNFDGLDLDWEYPVCWQTDCSKGPASDKAAFSLWVRELSEALHPRGLLLSTAVSASKTVVDAGYDVPGLAKHMDWIAVMAYDFHGQWDKKTGHVAPLYYHPEDDVSFFNANYSMHYWISQGAPSRKLVMGMPLYGQSFTLGTSWDTPPALVANKDKRGLNVPARAGGQAGEFTRAQGFLAYYEICDRVRNHGWTVEQDKEGRMGPHAYKGDQWVGYDDKAMIRKKTEFVKDLNLGGAMVWALDLDDFKNSCGEGRHPLLSTIRDVLKDATGPEYEIGVVPAVGIEEEEIGVVPAHEIEEEEIGVVPAHGIDEEDFPPPPSPPQAVLSEEEEEEEENALSTEENEYKMVCYFTNWAWYRQGPGKFLPGDIDPSLCTHIMYGFAVLDTQTLTLKPHDSWADIDNKFYEKVTALRSKRVKVLLALGGWNDSAGDKYSRLVNNAAARRKFVLHVLDFVLNNNFDGLDLDWEYPVCWQVECTMGPASDKEGFSALVKELREAFRPHNLLLTAAVSPNRKVIDAGYDVPVLSENLDWIAVMTYDYHGQWDKKTGHVAPMYEHPDDLDKGFNVNYTIHHWIARGAARSKLVLGLSLYGQSFSLAASDKNGLNSPTYGGGEAGESTRARGFLSYYEICERVQKRQWAVVHDPRGRMGPYAFKGDQWVSFDDIAMIRHKTSYLKAMGLAGGMVWALDLDDFRNTCGCERSPLLSAAARELGLISSPQPQCELESPSTEISTVQPPIKDDVKPPEFPKPVIPDIPPLVTVATSSGGPCLGRIFTSDPSDCNRYFLCNQGTLMAQNCPAGLHWNVDHCDWPSNAKCKTPSLPPQVTAAPVTVAPYPTAAPEATTTAVAIPGLPPVAAPPAGRMVVCYFTNWAWYRQGEGKYTPEDIDSSLCTHIAYGFAVLDSTALTIKPHDSWADIDNDFYGKVTALKKKGKKVLIAIGGWNDSLGDKYSRLVNSPANRARFVSNVVEFIEKWHFDGLDLDWEYPKCWQVDCNAGPASDKAGFASLVKELREAFSPRGWLLSAAVSASKMVIDAAYDVPALARDLDWIAVMTYDYHGHWDRKTGHVSPLYYYPGDTYDYFNTNFSMNYWMQKGAPASKLVLGVPLYGQSFTLADPTQKGMNVLAAGAGEAGEFTKAAGFLAYYEICDRVKRRGWSVERDPSNRVGPWAGRGLQWVSFDDTEQVARKAALARDLGLGGAMIWALDLDDFRGRCNCGRHPLLSAINSGLQGLPTPPCEL